MGGMIIDYGSSKGSYLFINYLKGPSWKQEIFIKYLLCARLYAKHCGQQKIEASTNLTFF